MKSAPSPSAVEATTTPVVAEVPTDSTEAASMMADVVATPVAVESPLPLVEETTMSRPVAEAEEASTMPSVEETIGVAENNTREGSENIQQSGLAEAEDPDINYEAAAAIADEEETHRGKKIEISSNLQEQKKKIIYENYAMYKEKAMKGEYWVYPPQRVTNRFIDKRKCWINHFQLPVFNFIPSAIFTDGWKPRCESCGQKCTSGKTYLQRHDLI